jgi:hypothetical protein
MIYELNENTKILLIQRFFFMGMIRWFFFIIQTWKTINIYISKKNVI